MNRFEGQRICIVGGTAGMGLAIARRAASEGASIVLTGRKAEAAAAQATTIGAMAEGRALDATVPADIEAFFVALGPVDHLVVTAASVRSGPFRTGKMEDARYTVEGKFWSQYLCARHAQVRRSILLFSGALSRRPRPGFAILSAVNAAVDALGKALAVELAPLRVNVMSPGLVQGTAAFDHMPAEARDAMIAQAAAGLPAGLVGGPESIAAVALALLESDYVTGSVVDVDGGGLIR